MHEPEPGVVRAELDDNVATCREHDDVTHGRIDKVQGRGSSVAPRWPRAQHSVALDVLIVAQVTTSGGVVGRIAHGQDREVVSVHVDRMLSQEGRDSRVVVDEHHSDCFVEREIENVGAATSAGIACCLVTRHDVFLSAHSDQTFMNCAVHV